MKKYFKQEITLDFGADFTEITHRGSIQQRSSSRLSTYLQTKNKEIQKILNSSTKIIHQLNPQVLQIPFKVYSLGITQNQQNLIFGSDKGNLAIWDRDQRGIVSDIPIQAGMIYSLILTVDSKQIIAAGEDSSIRVFENPSFVLIKELENHTQHVNKLCLSHDGRFLYSTSKDETVRKWDLSTLQELDVIMKHQEGSITVSVSPNGKYVFSGGEDNLVKVYSNELKEQVKSLSGHSDSICSLAVSPDSGILASGSYDSSIRLWQISDFSYIKSLTDHTLRVQCLKFSPNNYFLVSGSFDMTIKVWEIEDDKEPVTLAGHESPIMEVQLNLVGDSIFSCSEDQTIRIWPFPQQKYQRIIKTKNNVTAMVLTSDLKFLIAGSSDSTIKVWKFDTGALEYILKGHSRTVNQLKLVNDFELISCCDQGFMIHWDLKTKKEIKRITANIGAIKALTINANLNMICSGGADARITCWDISTFAQLDIMRGHRQVISALSINYSGQTLVSGSADKTIRVWSVHSYQETGCLKGHKSKITCLTFGKEDKYLISGSSDHTIKIWSILDSVIQVTFDCHEAEITSLLITSDNSYLFSTGKDKKLCVFSLKERIKIAETSTLKTDTNCLAMSESEQWIVTGHNSACHIIENPLKIDYFRLIGPSQQEYLFINYIYKLLKDPEPPLYDPKIDKWLIMPYQINVLHYYAYYDIRLHLNESLKNGAAFIKCSSGDTPLNIALTRELSECAELMMLNLVQRAKQNPNQMLSIEDSLAQMNTKGFGVIEEFYDNVFSKSEQTGLPKFCSKKVSLPIYNLSTSTRIYPSSFLNPSKISPEGQNILFKNSFIRVSLEIGSQASLEFLNSILYCPNQNILKTQFIQAVLFYKWSLISKWIFAQTAVYTLYLLILGLFSIFFFETMQVLYLVLTLNSILSLYQLFQFAVAPIYYIQDIWNVIDLLRAASCYIFVYLQLQSSSQSLINLFLVLTTIFSWLRGITYFRISKSTRYLINLIKEVVKDMTAFLVILIYSTLAFSFIYTVIDWEENREDFAEQWIKSYRIDLGDFEVDGISLVEYGIFTLATLVNPIIMLNLLIAIMSDTYERVQEGIIVADMKEMLMMMLEIESLMFWKRKRGDKFFLQICSSQKEEKEAEDSWENKIQEINQKFEDMAGEVRRSQEAVQMKLNQIDLRLQKLEKSIIDRMEFTRKQMKAMLKSIESAKIQ